MSRPDADGDRARPRCHAVVVTRVEWTQTELAAMFVNREHVNSVRITPSKGDGGVDILDRDARARRRRRGVPGQAVHRAAVGQAEGRGRGIAADAHASDPRWSGLNVTAWHLVTPWDPTPEAETWLHGLASARRVHPGLAWTRPRRATRREVPRHRGLLPARRPRAGSKKRTRRLQPPVRSRPERGENLDVPGVAARIEKALPAPRR